METNKRMYDHLVIKILFMIAKIVSRYGEKTFAHEIEKLEKEIFESEENK